MEKIDLSLAGGFRESQTRGGAGDRSGLEVKLLGSVRVLLDGRPVALGGPRSRQLLALLALHVNEMVPADRVVGTLWGDAPPASVRQQVYNVVALVRRCLDGHAGIERSGSGYQLTLGDGQIDAVRFQRGVAWAERAAARGEFGRAVGLLESALEEWRGQALADLEGEVFQVAADLLQEQRLAAVERLAGWLLQVGDGSGAVRRLTPLVSEYPFRESLRALLMRGLHRVGRQAEALVVFEEGRRVLSEELGVDPGAGLQEAHQEVLRGEVDPGPVRELSVGRLEVRVEGDAGGRAPCQLPADVRVLVGRERELAELTGLAEVAGEAGRGGSVTVLAIDGMGGVGKSALAVRAGHLLRERFADGQLYIDLHGHTPGMAPVEPGEALGSFLQALGVQPHQVPDDVDMRAACFRDRLADTRTLLVLDNAASTAQVEALLPGTAGCMVLVTSRRRLAGLGDAHQISLRTLPEDVAVDLLQKAAEPAPVQGGYEVAAELVGVCGHLPLAIKIVAARLKLNRALTAQSLMAELREEDSRLGRLSDGERELGGVFDSSVRVLPEGAQRLYRLLGLVPGPDFDAYAAANLLGTNLHAAERLLQLLFDHNLLLQSAAGRYKFHDLLHAHARGLAAADVRHPEALDRLLEYYLRTAQAANQYLSTRYRQTGLSDAQTGESTPELLNPGQAIAWLRTELPGLLAALSTPAMGPARMIVLIQALSAHLMFEGMWSPAVGLHRRAVGIARERGDRPAEANALLDAATVLERQGQLDAAIEDATQALAVYRDLGDRLGEANSLAALGQVHYVRSGHTEAFALYGQALEAYEELGDQRGVAKCSWRLGAMLSFRGDVSMAADPVRRAIAIYRELGDEREETGCLLNYSRILYSLHDFAAVRPTLDRALSLGRRSDFRLGVANVLQETAMHQVRAGEYAEATESLEEALRINRELGFPLGEGYDYLLLGRISFTVGDLDRAQDFQSRAVALFRKIKNYYESSALESLARIHQAKGDLDRAAQLVRRALSLLESVRNPFVEILVEVRNAAGGLKLDMEGPESALVEYRAAIDSATRGRVPYEHARALEGAARCEFLLGRRQDGLAHLREAVDEYRAIGAAEYGPAESYLTSVIEG